MCFVVVNPLKNTDYTVLQSQMIKNAAHKNAPFALASPLKNMLYFEKKKRISSEKVRLKHSKTLWCQAVVFT